MSNHPKFDELTASIGECLNANLTCIFTSCKIAKDGEPSNTVISPLLPKMEAFTECLAEVTRTLHGATEEVNTLVSENTKLKQENANSDEYIMQLENDIISLQDQLKECQRDNDE